MIVEITLGIVILELMFDGLDEISYIKKFTNIMQNSRYRDFFCLIYFTYK